MSRACHAVHANPLLYFTFTAAASEWGQWQWFKPADNGAVLLTLPDTEATITFTHLEWSTTAAAAAAVPLSSSLELQPTCTPSAAPFFGSEELSDCTVVTDDGQTLFCHKVVLSMASSVFRAMFTSGMQESSSNRVEVRWVLATTAHTKSSCRLSQCHSHITGVLALLVARVCLAAGAACFCNRVAIFSTVETAHDLTHCNYSSTQRSCMLLTHGMTRGNRYGHVEEGSAAEVQME